MDISTAKYTVTKKPAKVRGNQAQSVLMAEQIYGHRNISKSVPQQKQSKQHSKVAPDATSGSLTLKRLSQTQAGTLIDDAKM